ncbi:hypothetical protein D9757_001250 [Collybiopsis confluens]|uniref:Uncharacterized protein n=1 Tax=Collybiopsis confluens TaxID=2823264 RepID=A0A8H5MGL5_9AGAR|nr:hypothetical protein D9757_001250 [Collybiopsis confluens]
MEFLATDVHEWWFHQSTAFFQDPLDEHPIDQDFNVTQSAPPVLNSLHTVEAKYIDPSYLACDSPNVFVQSQFDGHCGSCAGNNTDIKLAPRVDTQLQLTEMALNANFFPSSSPWNSPLSASTDTASSTTSYISQATSGGQSQVYDSSYSPSSTESNYYSLEPGDNGCHQSGLLQNLTGIPGSFQGGHDFMDDNQFGGSLHPSPHRNQSLELRKRHKHKVASDRVLQASRTRRKSTKPVLTCFECDATFTASHNLRSKL